MGRQNRVWICSAIQQCAEQRRVAACDRIRKKRHVLPVGCRWRRMFAKEPLNFVLLSGLERPGQSASRAGCPIPCRRQTLEHGFDDLRISAIQSKRQEILSVRAWLFRVKISRARKE
ncbi:MAG: hypothetical protein DME53_03670 [Verrucomicrobia bacterium]|nr:MAG: hypothetical protein DME53_03670 [Verrucomicrobiota bacterium]